MVKTRDITATPRGTITLATLVDQSPARDYFRLPRIDSDRRRAATRLDPTEFFPVSPYQLPPLDSFHQPASAHLWPGANSSTGAGQIPAQQAINTLPTPPTDGTEGYKEPGPIFKSEFPNLATAALQQPGMPSSFEHTGAPTSLTQRRPATGNLPPFEIPPPPTHQLHQKYSLPQLNAPQGTTVGGGNLLTPPSTVPGETLSPLSQILSTVTANPGLQPNYPYNWQLPGPTGLTPLLNGTASGNTPQPWPAPLNPVKGLFSPSLAGSLPRGESNSPTAGEGLPPPPPFDINPLLPLPASMSMGAPGAIPAATANQQATIQALMAQSQTQTQTPVSATTTQPSPISGTDAFAQRSQSTPTTFYSHSQPSSAQQNAFSPFNNQSSPVQQSPMSAPPQGSRLSPTSAQSATFSPPASQTNGYGRPSYPSYLPGMSAPVQIGGPIMSNMHNPGHPMGYVGMQSHGLPMIPGYNSGHAAQIQAHMYGAPASAAPNERPFRCDQCPQSFNRNHDLKRHKRIHLAVKPFPCGYCDKSFSRKDALKVGLPP